VDKLDEKQREQILSRLKNLSLNPVPSDAKFIGRDKDGEKIFRYRIGMFRSLYKVKHSIEIILVAKIDKRPKVYQ
jgi:mRNA-degrading endonuclease RelE of RelBE toxin-antitoxin system